MQANSLIANTAKTVALIITPQLHHSISSANDKSSINFTFNNQIVQPSISAKYLGTVSPRFTTVSTYDVSRLQMHFKCSALGSFVFVICIVHDVNNCELLRL